MDSVVKDNLVALGQTLLEAPKGYKHYQPSDFPIHKGKTRVYRAKLSELTSGDTELMSNAIGHLPLILLDVYNDPEQEVKVDDLAIKHLYGLTKAELDWINSAKTARQAGIACLYLVLRGTFPNDWPSKPALARKKAREALCL